MAPDTAIGNEWKRKESGKAGFHGKLSSNTNQPALRAGEIPSLFL